ncbi:RraA family protein [Paraburkholderia silvatlantica]|uniref:RraA family protein n=1 Tax=Paraburkholderia silvatlantica TaxID=321895 RepID=UPI003750111E
MRKIDEGSRGAAAVGIPDALLEAAQSMDTATLHEASGKNGALPHGIKPAVQGFRVCGRALTVHSPGGDNLWIHKALYAARPGDVLVVFAEDQYEYGYWGEIMSFAAQCRDIGGLVIDGCVRDSVQLAQVGFPVFARGLCVRGTAKDKGAKGWINAPIRMGDVTVCPGDLVVGDADGVVAIAQSHLEQVVQSARDRQSKERGILERLGAGESTLSIYNLG